MNFYSCRGQCYNGNLYWMSWSYIRPSPGGCIVYWWMLSALVGLGLGHDSVGALLPSYTLDWGQFTRLPWSFLGFWVGWWSWTKSWIKQKFRSPANFVLVESRYPMCHVLTVYQTSSIICFLMFMSPFVMNKLWKWQILIWLQCRAVSECHRLIYWQYIDTEGPGHGTLLLLWSWHSYNLMQWFRYKNTSFFLVLYHEIEFLNYNKNFVNYFAFKWLYDKLFVCDVILTISNL